MPSTYSCRTCGFSFSSGRINWASPTCASCEVTARAEQRLLGGLADARATSSPLAFWGVRHSHRVSGPPRPEPPRERVEPSVPPIPPSARYLAVAGESGVTLPSAQAAAHLESLVVVLSLNDTLLYRVRGQARSSIRPIVRPYLSTFFSYLCRQALDTTARQINIVVFSAAKAHNVSTLLRAIGLERDPRMVSMLEGIRIASTGADEGGDGVEREREVGQEACALVRLVLSRELMGLNEVDYSRDIVVIKDLAIAWRGLELDVTEGTRTTVLVDESDHASFSQPYSRLPIRTFAVDDPRSAFSHDGIQELPSSMHDDTTLLSTIYFVERLRCESNIAAALKSGLVQRAEDEARREVRMKERRVESAEVTAEAVEEVLARKGRAVCAEYGVKISREWDGEWSEKVRKASRGAQPCAGAVPEL
ncbi:hypothetical protein JCM9279_002113 [Rhodotorula babjevae]